MLRMKKGQTISEYMLIVLMSIGALTAMSVFFNRVLQGRVHDGQNYMVKTFVNEIRTELGMNGFVGNYHYEYEPYYTVSVSDIDQNAETIKELTRDENNETMFKKTVSQESKSKVIAETLPPAYGN